MPLKEILFWFCLVLLLLGVVFLIIGFSSSFKSFVIENPNSSLKVKQNQNHIKIIAVGDIMLDRGVEYMINKEAEGDFTFPFQKIKPSFQGADLIFGNLESVISDKGYKVGSIYSFRAEPEAIEGLKFAGFSVINLAQNHAFDYTTAALEDTMERLETAGIAFIGAGKSAEEAFSLKVLEVKGVKIGFLGYTNLGPNSWRAGLENKTGIAWIDREAFPSLRENIQTAKQQVDILVVSLHAGEEYQTEPTLFQRDFANLVVAEGADLVLMHHSHVVGPLETVQNKFVAFGLGNFIFDQAFSEATMEGGWLEITIQDKAISDVVLQKVKLNEFYQPELPDL